MKKEEQFKKEFINEQLRPFGTALIITLLPIILSPLMWIWHSGDLALKFIITGVFLWIIVCISGRIAKHFIVKTYEMDLAEREECNRRLKEEKQNKPKSSFIQRLEDIQNAQQEQIKNRNK